MTDTPDIEAGERLASYGDRYLILGNDLQVAARDDDGNWRRFKLCLEERAAIIAAWAEAKPGEPVFVHGFNFVIGGATRSAERATPDGPVNINGPVFFDLATGVQTPIRADHPALTLGIPLGAKPSLAS